MNQANYGFVQFKLEESAKAALLRSNHRIGNEIPNITAAHDSLQPDFELILRMLDDECLKQVFLRLRLKDLSNAADVCIRFKNAANWVFKTKFKWLEFDVIRYDDYIYMRQDADSIMEELKENVFRNFGPLMCSLGRIDNEKVLELVSRYCVDKSNLKALHFFGVNITKNIVERFRNVFKQLNQLRFDYIKFDTNVSDLFPICTDLDDLWFWTRSDPNAKVILDNLLISNLKLKKINIQMRNTEFNSSESFRSYLRAPSELNIGFNHQYLSKFSMLNDLTLDFSYQIVSPVLKNLVENKIPINRLYLSKGVMYHDGFESICQMNQMNQLDLSSICSPDLNENHLIELSKNLPDLREMRLNQCSIKANADSLKRMISHLNKLKSLRIGVQPETKIELNDYNTMLEIVKNRPVKTHLEIIMRGDNVNVDVPEEIRKKNRAWFEIHGVTEADWFVGFCIQIESD